MKSNLDHGLFISHEANVQLANDLVAYCDYVRATKPQAYQRWWIADACRRVMSMMAIPNIWCF